MAKLILEGGDAREVVVSEICRIGRDQGNEVFLDDPGLSRRHCRIFKEGQDYILEDLKSANGTFQNGERVDRAKLQEGDQITLGNCSLRFTLAGAAAAALPDSSELSLEEPAGAGGRFELVFLTGERRGERARLVADRITFGRKSSNTVVLKDAKVSGVHCEVALEDGRPVLRDLGSTNGTFLEGKRIDEIVLDHGDRITLGENELRLIDITRGSPAAGDAPGDLNAAQTMIAMPEVHVVRDLTRARKSPLAMAGLLLVLAALAAGGWFYWKVQAESAKIVLAPPAPGNLLGERWSFEAVEEAPDPVEAWDFETGRFKVVSHGARSGQQLLVGEPGGEAARAALQDGIKISGRKYRISGFAKVTGEAVAILTARFQDSADLDFEVVVPVGSSQSGDWQELSGELVPPTGATHLVLLLTGSGPSGVVQFDDLGVFDAGVTRVVVESINLFEFERAGENLLVRRGSDLLQIGPLSLRPAGAGESSGESSVEPEARGAGRYLHQGSILLQDGRSVRYSSAFAADSRSADWRLEWDAEGVPLAGVELPIDLLVPLLDDPVGVFRSGVLEPYLDSFEAGGVSALVLGRGLTRMRLQFEPEVQIEAARQPSRFSLKIQPAPAAGRLAVQMQVDFVEEKAEAGELAGVARAAQADGRLGEALQVLHRIQNEFPFDEDILEESRKRQNEISRERERIENELKAAVARAAFLQSPTAYEEAESAARKAEAAFAATPEAQRFARSAEQLAEDREAIVSASRERAAAQLLERLETLLSQTPPQERAAREIAEYLEQTYPGSTKAAEARTMLRKSDGG